MAKTANILRWCANTVLGLGSFCALSENPDNLTPNIIGLACFFLLMALNKDKADD